MNAEHEPCLQPHVAACPRGHALQSDLPAPLPCPWPECSEHAGNTLSMPGVAEFPIGPLLRDGLDVGEIIGTFWRESTLGGWRWHLLGSRERLHP